MNPINYTTLEQSIKFRKFGYPQDKTDAVWIRLINQSDFILVPRFVCSVDMMFYWIRGTDVRIKIGEWFAAPNSQEIEFEKPNLIYTSATGESTGHLIHFAFNHMVKGYPDDKDMKDFGMCHHAQARADARIWEEDQVK